MKLEAKTDRRIIKTKEAINKAFLALFAEKEFEQITINDISERANINRGTVYLHYQDKFDLLDKNIENHLNELVAFCVKNETSDKEALISSDLQPIFDYLESNFKFFSALFANRRTFVFRERLLHFISASVRAKRERQDLQSATDSELSAQFLASAFVGIVEWWIQHDMPHPPETMAKQLQALFDKFDR